MDVRLPDGTVVTNVPEGTTQAELLERLKAGGYDVSWATPAVPKESTILGEAKRGAKQFISTGRTAVGAARGSPEEAARAGLERSQQIEEEAGEGPSLARIGRVYEERGLLPAAGQVLSDIPRFLAQQAPQIGATIGGARLGAMAGSAFGPAGTLIGGGVGAIGANVLPMFGSAVQRQAATQIEEGKPVDISLGRAAAATAGSAALEAAGTAGVIGKNAVKRVLGIGDDAALTAARNKESLVKAAQSTIAGGAIRGAAIEMPVEVAQSVLDRWQAGLDVTSDDAFQEYGESMYAAGLVGGPIGGVSAIPTRRAAQRALEETEPLAPGQRRGETLEQTANRLNLEVRGLTEQLQPPPPSPFLSGQELASIASSEDGFGKLVQYEEKIKQEPASPERNESLRTSRELRRRLEIEAGQRQAEPTKPYPFDPFAPEPFQFKSGTELVDLVNQIEDPAGKLARILEYRAEVKAQPASAEREQALKDSSALYDEVNKFAQSQGFPAPKPFTLRASDLTAAGINKKDPLFEQLKGKDINKPDDVDTVVKLTEEAQRRPDITPELFDRLEGLLTSVEAHIRDLPGSGFYGQRTYPKPSGAGVSVAGQPEPTVPAGGAEPPGRMGMVGPTATAAPTVPREEVPRAPVDEFFRAKPRAEFARAIGASGGDELKARRDNPNLKAAVKGENLGGVLNALARSKSPVVAEVARRGAPAGTTVKIDDDAVEKYVGRSFLDDRFIIAEAKNLLALRDAIKNKTSFIETVVVDQEGNTKNVERLANDPVILRANPYWMVGLKQKDITEFTLPQLEQAVDNKIAELGEDQLKLTATASAIRTGVAGGAYDPDTKTIRLAEYFSKDEGVVTHELVHAQVVEAVANPTKEQRPHVERLTKLYEHVKANAKERDLDFYGVSSIQEFIAEGMSNPRFQFFLNTIPYEKQSAWTKFVQTIADLLGIKNNTAFLELLTVYDRIAPPAKPKKQARKSLKKIEGPVTEAKIQAEKRFLELEARAKQPSKPEPAKEEPAEVKDIRAERAEKISQLQGVLEKILAKYGLKDVKLNLEEGMKDDGSYEGQLIKLALDLDNPVRTLRHEAIHALKELGFFTPQQWKVLTDRAKSEWIEKYLKNQIAVVDGKEVTRYDAYIDLYKGDQDKIIEEAIADAFGDFVKTKAPPGMMQAILKRMENLFKAIKQAFNQSGYQTAEDVFGKIEEGKLTKAEKLVQKVDAGAKPIAQPSVRAAGKAAEYLQDNKGQPLVLYHGTMDEVDPASFNVGSHFGTAKAANARITQRGKGIPGVSTGRGVDFTKANIVPVVLKMSNPLQVDDQEASDEATLRRGIIQGKYPELSLSVANKEGAFEAARQAGYDGLVYINRVEDAGKKSYVTLYPEQAESAIGIKARASLRAPDTQAFKRWFGDSKVVDADGNPLVMYHGTTKDFSIFQTTAGAIFVTPDRSFANKFAMDDMLFTDSDTAIAPSGANVMPVYVRAERPFDFENPADIKKVQQLLDPADRKRFSDVAASGRWQVIEDFLGSVEDAGFDSAYILEQGVKNLAVFSPTQIKSAIGNVGTFDVTSPDIRKSLRAPDTKEFDTFFGNSKIVDKDGEPKVMYHGTARDITSFVPKQAGAIFLTDDPTFAEGFANMSADWMARHADQFLSPEQAKAGKEAAIKQIKKDYRADPKLRDKLIAALDDPDSMYATDAREILGAQYKDQLPSGPNIMPVFVRAENPFDFDNPDHIRQIQQYEYENRYTPSSIFHLMNQVEKGGWEAIEDPLVQQAIKQLGFDGFYVKEVGKKNLAVYSSNQIKSAIGNQGTYDITNADIRLSLRTLPTLPTDVTDRIKQTVIPRERPGMVGRLLDAISPRTFSKFRSEFVNRYDALARFDRQAAEQIRLMGGTEQLADAKAESAALFSDLSGGLAASAMGVNDRVGGIPVYVRKYIVEKDFKKIGPDYPTKAAAEAAAKRVGGQVFEQGYTTISNANGVKGLIAIFSDLAKYKKPAENEPSVFDQYQFWADVKRASKYILNPGTGKYEEKLFTKDDIRRAAQIEKAFPEFVQIQKEWIKYNDGLVDFMRDTGVISEAGAKEMKKHGDYFPFYRHLGEDDIQGPRLFSSIANVKSVKAAKGSEAEVTDFFETIVRNTQSAIQAGIKNVAARRATDQAMRIGEVFKLNRAESGPTVYRVLEDGKETYYRAQDPYFIDALKSLNQPDLPFIGLLAGPAKLLRNLVTKDPAFQLANMMRDSLSAYVSSGYKFTPMVATLKQYGTIIAGKSPEFNALLRGGVIGGYDYSQGVEASAEKLEKEMRKVAGAKTTLEKIASPVTSLWGALEKSSEASDAATRNEIYKRVLAETGNEAEALYQALEVMNFNRKGRSPIIRILTAAVPFMNARIQGLDVLYRSGMRPIYGKDATEQEKARLKTFWVRGMTMMALSSMYWVLTSDDEEYKKQEQEVRDNYWLFPSLGIKIPIPFEIGVMFKVVPERILEYAFGSDTGQDFRKAMGRHLLSTFGFNPIPQTFLPAIEVTANYSFFTQRPIITQGMENIAPEYQVGPNTSKIAGAIGQSLGISPIKLDYLIQGYTGTMGMYAVNLFDSIFSMNDEAPKPSRRLEQMPVLRRFMVDPEARGQITAYYDLKNSVDQVVRTSNYLERSMDFEQYGKYMQDNIKMFAARDYINDLEKTMKEFREMKNLVRISQMDADTKRDNITNIGRLEQQLTQNIKTLKKQLAAQQ